MKRTHLIAAIACLVAIAGVSQDAFARGRMYHPGLGRYMQRDPLGTADEPPMARNLSASQFTQRDPTEQYTDGPNLYQYVGSNPVVYVDPLGLWKIKREGDPKAAAEAEAGDTIKGLADIIGLNESEFQQWLTVAGPIKVMAGGTKQLSALSSTEAICPGESVEIPNTVLTYWAGELGDFGEFWVMWQSDYQTLKDRGFHVTATSKTVRVRELRPGRVGKGHPPRWRYVTRTIEVPYSGWNANQLENYIQTGSGNRELHGVFFWGHGYDKTTSSTGGVLTDSSQSGNGAYYSDYGNWNPAYKMGLGVLFACHTQNGRSQFSSSPAVKFWGKKGVLVPHGFHLFGTSIDRLLPPGAQGTKR